MGFAVNPTAHKPGFLDLAKDIFKLSLFAADRDKIISEAKAFFRKAESDPMAQDIPSEFRRLSAILQGRISREENLLMKTYEKVAGL